MEGIQETFSDYYDMAIMHLPKYVVAVVSVFILLFTLRLIRKRLSNVLLSKADDKLLVNFIDSVF